MRVKITFTEEVLGTSCSEPDVHGTYIASKAPDAKSKEEEVEALGVEEVVKKGMTVFPRENDKPFLWDYQFKGFFKDACSMLRRVKGTKSEKLTAHKKVIDGMVFVKPRKIILNMPEKGEVGNCQRPLRGQTPQGERITLANSETVPAGTSVEIDINLLDSRMEKLMEEWLDYGALRGMCQWRNSGKGSFTWEKI